MKIHDNNLDRDLYFEWSTIVDAPITMGMSLEQFKQYYKDEYGRVGAESLDRYLKRIDEVGICYGHGNEKVDEFLLRAFEINKLNGNKITSLTKLMEALTGL